MEKKINIYDRKNVVIICAVVLAIIGAISLVYNNKGSSLRRISSEDVKKVSEAKKTALIYVESSDSEKCKKCAEIKKHLDSTKVDYMLYDTAKSGKDDYQKMLDVYGIQIDSFKQPALLYIKKGYMYSNIINIDNTSIVDQFLKDNKLVDK